MAHKIAAYNEDGTPSRVHIHSGFMETSRPYNQEKDGWIETQLNPYDFEVVRVGRETESLLHEINALRRENFELKQIEKEYLGMLKRF